MGQLMVHGKTGRHLALILLLGPAEQVGVTGFAHTQHHQLHILVHNVAQHAVHQIQTLLIAQTAYHGDQRDVGIHFQTQIALELHLVLHLDLQRIGGVVLVDQRVGLGVVLIHVDAVEHAIEAVVAGTDEAIHALAVVGGGDFLSIAGAHGGDHIAVHQTGLHEVGAAVAFQLVGGEQVIAQTQHILHFLDAENALILQVVDGVHGAHVGVEGQMLVLDLQKGGHHAALPVVGMDDVRLEIQQGQGVEGGTAEEAIALVLVATQTVHVGTAEVVLVVQEVVGHAVLFQLLNAAVLAAPAQLHVEVEHELHIGLILLVDGGVHGQDDANIMALLAEHGSQRADHVRQTAGLDKGYAFAGSKENLHEGIPPSLHS